jgi:HEAT repeat protein
MRQKWLSVASVLCTAYFALSQDPDDALGRLRDPDAKVRRLAAEALGKVKSEVAIPALVKLLKDPETSVRLGAADALARIGTKSIPALTGALNEPEETTRLAALTAIARLAPVARQTLSKEMLAAWSGALKDPSTQVRIQAAVVLGRCGPDAKPALPALFAAAKDTSNLGSVIVKGMPSSVTEAAVEAALQVDPDCGPALAQVALPALTAALKTKDQATLQAAGYALAKLGTHAKGALAALEEARPHARGFAESAIGAALRAVGGDGLKPLATLIRDPKAPLEKRVGALSELGWVKNPDDTLVAILVEALKDPEPRVRAAAAEAVGTLGPKAKATLPALLELLGDMELEQAAKQNRRGTDEVLPVTVANLGADGVPGLAAVVKDPAKKPAARYQAIVALSLLGRKAKAALPVLEAAMQDKIAPLAAESACAYALAGGDPTKSLAVLRDSLKHQSPFVNWTAARAVERLGPRARAVVPDLLPLLKHAEPDVRIMAARAFGKLGPDAKPAVPALAELLKSGDGRQRFQVALALGELGPDAAPALPSLVEQLPRLEKMNPHPVLMALGKLGPAAKPALPDLLKLLGGDDIFADEVLNVVGQIGPEAKPAVPVLIEHLRKPGEDRRARAARALGQIGPEAKAAAPELRKVLQDESLLVRVWAAFAQARLTGDAKQPVALLMEYWEDDQADGLRSGLLRYDIAQALALLGSEARAARDLLLDALLNPQTPPGTREQAARALGHLRADAEVIVPKLVALLERPGEGYTRRWNCEHAALALGMLGPTARAAVPILRRLAEDDEYVLAEAASKAIGQIEGK